MAAIGLLLAQYTFCGYDASAHLSEETSNASVSAARGIVRSIWVSWIAGFVLLAGLTFAIQDYAGTQDTATGVPPAQILIDALGTSGATALLLIVIVAQLFCGNAEVAAASRMVFAFSRDNALPGSALWRKVSARTQTPVNAVWLSVVVAGLLALPSLYSATAYGAVTAINVIGITPAYAIPIFLKLRAGDRFQRGPWHLGRWSEADRLDRRGVGGDRDRTVLLAAVVAGDHRLDELCLDRPGGGTGAGHRLVVRRAPFVRHAVRVRERP